MHLRVKPINIFEQTSTGYHSPSFRPSEACKGETTNFIFGRTKKGRKTNRVTYLSWINRTKILVIKVFLIITVIFSTTSIIERVHSLNDLLIKAHISYIKEITVNRDQKEVCNQGENGLSRPWDPKLIFWKIPGQRTNWN